MAVVIGALRLVSNQHGRCQLVSLLAGEFVLIPLVDHWSVSLVRLLPTAAAVIGYRFGVTWVFVVRWRLVGLVWSVSSMSMWLSDGILSLVRGVFQFKNYNTHRTTEKI